MRAGGSNHKRVERIWRQEGLKIPLKQPKRGRLWLNDGSIVRFRPEFPKHVWSYDFMQDRTHNGVTFRILNVIDEYTRECLAVKIERRLTHRDVLDALFELFCERGVPVHIRSDNGSEFTQNAYGPGFGQVVCEAIVYRAREPLGERLHRVLQRQDER